MRQTNRLIPRSIEIILGIVFIIFGLLAFNQPGATLGFLILWFGFLAIFRGVSLFIHTLLYGREESAGIFGLNILMSIIDFLIGWLLVTNIYRGIVLIGVVFAIWFIMDSLSNLMNIQRFQLVSGFWKILLIIFDILCLFIGVMLLFNPVTGALTLPILIGIYSILFGIISLVLAFRH